MKIETENLELIQCSEEILKAAIESNEKLSQILGCKVEENWSEFGAEAFPYVIEKIKSHPQQMAWWTYFPIHKMDNQLIGSGGYKGSPNTDGMVEIGYEISPAYRNKGYATEMAKGLINNALIDPNVTIIQAHTLAHKNASTGVLIKCGFKKIEEIVDSEDDKIWRWELDITNNN